MWIRYRFHTRADDFRPIVFNPSYPWWCTGYAGDDSYAVIVAYLPPDEPLERYWDDAEEVDQTACDAITFTDRFPRPKWFVEADAKGVPIE